MSRNGNEITRAILEKVENDGLPIDATDWNQVHIQTAIAAMHAELSNPNNEFMACEDKCGIIVRRAVRYADALTNELKKGGNK